MKKLAVKLATKVAVNENRGRCYVVVVLRPTSWP